MSPPPKTTVQTSVDIMHERDRLRERTARLEAELVTVKREIEYALRFPEINMLSMCRIHTVACRALGAGDD
jgi:hypothetical protein